MRILVVGGGGREHALCWAISNSPLVEQVYCAPGNGGISDVAECVDLKQGDVEGISSWATKNSIDLVLPGPEEPLVRGLTDRLNEYGVRCAGPSAAAARLEGSKLFMKTIANRANVPTAQWERTNDAETARSIVREFGFPVVIKADGLAAGKGVFIVTNEEEAEAAIDRTLVDEEFGDAGKTLVIEEYLDGEELSFHALVDGRDILPLASSQDHKRLGEGDTGPNTGGMGSYSPAPVMTDEIEKRITSEIIQPVVDQMAKEGTPFRGVLYAGLMVTTQGPKVLEINVRFGDPECQSLMVRLRSDIVPALLAMCDGDLKHVDLRWQDEAALTVVMATKGYPDRYPRETEINLGNSNEVEGVEIFHAATRRNGTTWLSKGGRVLGVTALDRELSGARDRAYSAIDRIVWPSGHYRRDIGWRALNRVAD